MLKGLVDTSLNINKITQDATSIIFEDIGLIGGSIFLIDKKNPKILKAYTYTLNKNTHALRKIIGNPFNKLSTPLDNPQNLIGKTATQGKIFIGNDLENFFLGLANKKIIKLTHKSVRAKSYISLPIKYQKKIYGVVLAASPESKVTDQQKKLLIIFSEQLGLAINNALEYELITRKYFEKTKAKKGLTGNNNSREDILKETKSIFVCASSFHQTATSAVNLITKDLDLIGAGIFILNNSGNIQAFTFSTNPLAKRGLRLLGFNDPEQFILKKENGANNLTWKTFTLKHPQHSTLLEDFSKGFPFEKLSSKIQKKIGLKHISTFPLLVQQKPIGIIFYASKYIPPEHTIQSFETFSKQVSLALSNVIAQENILKKYQAEQKKIKHRNQEKPTIKFTLRLTPSIIEFLEWKASRSKLSKADYLRKLLKEEIMPNDKEYKKHLEKN